MEPWQQEALRQLCFDARQRRRPRCQCCGEHIRTERFAALEPFGLGGYACERCLEASMGYTEDLDEE